MTDPHKSIADHQAQVEAAEAEDGPHVRTWSVYAGVHGSKYLGEVKAATGEAAIEAAYNLDEASISLCHVCADEVQDPEVEHVTVVCGDEEATDRPQEDPRTAAALRLYELVERYAARAREVHEAGGGLPDFPALVIFPPLADEPWEIVEDSGAWLFRGVEGSSLAEAVEKALAELGRA